MVQYFAVSEKVYNFALANGKRPESKEIQTHLVR